MKQGLFLLLSLFLIAADQLTKWGVSEHMLRPKLETLGQPSGFLDWYTSPPLPLPFAQVELLPFFNFVMVWNRGISFGLFNHDIHNGPMILMILSLAITAIFLFLMMRSTSMLQSLGISMIIGGALGNVIDRARFGAVIDFLDFHMAGYHWPAFNVADSCVCVGVGVLIVQALFFERSAVRENVTVHNK